MSYWLRDAVLYTASMAKEEYEKRRDLHRASHRKFARLHLALSNLRGALFVAGVILLLLAGNHRLSFWWLLLPGVSFVVAAILHERVLQSRNRESRAVSFYERGLARIEDRWAGTGEPGSRFIDAAHPYTEDLDIFGKGSLFELLCIARTQSGEETLASWLKAPAGVEDVIARQGAVEDLRARLDFREDLVMLGSDIRSQQHPDLLIQWAQREPITFSASLRVIAAFLVLLTLIAFVGWAFFDWEAIILVASAILEVLFLRRIRPQIQTITRGAQNANVELKLLSMILGRIERESFSSPRMQELMEQLRTDGETPSRQIARIGRLLDFLDWQRNQLFTHIALLLMWEPQIAFALERWRAKCGPQIGKWLSIAGQIEALSCLSAYAYEHPSDPFPEMVHDGPLYEGVGLGHPLIPESHCVRNDLTVNRDTRVYIVSGSNMSGKSTLLRTLGINAVLALAGAPVRAARMRISPLQVGASIHILDSLQSGSSRFYAEITRLRQLMDLTSKPLTLLFLLDEILHGTNSADRLIGAKALIRGFLQQNAIGLLTTHDLALTQIAEKEEHIANIHFQDHIEDGRIAFDYRIHPGVVQKSNAVALMRAVGLDV